MEAFTQLRQMFNEIAQGYAEAFRALRRERTRDDYTLVPPAEPDPFLDPYDPDDAEAWIRLWYAVNLKTGEPLEEDDHGRLDA